MTGSIAREARTRLDSTAAGRTRRPCDSCFPCASRKTSHDPVYITPIYNMNYCRGLGNELVSASLLADVLPGKPRDVSLEEARITENQFCHGWLSSVDKWLLSYYVRRDEKALNKRI